MTLRLDLRRDGRVIVTTLLLALLANLGAYLFLVLPRERETEALRSERDNFEADFTAAKKRADSVRAAFEHISGAEKGLDTFYNDLLGTKQKKMVEIQREITKICQQFSIEPTEVHNDTQELIDMRVERFTFSLPLQGDYQNLRQFINRVESSDNFLLVESVSLSGTKEGGSQLALKVVVATYFDAPWLVNKKRGATRRGAA